MMDEQQQQRIDAAVSRAIAAAGGEALPRAERIKVGVHAIVAAIIEVAGRRPTLDETCVEAARLGLSRRRQTVWQYWTATSGTSASDRSETDPDTSDAGDDTSDEVLPIGICRALDGVATAIDHLKGSIRADLNESRRSVEERWRDVAETVRADAERRRAALEAQVRDLDRVLTEAFGDLEDASDRLEQVHADKGRLEAALAEAANNEARLADALRDAEARLAKCAADADAARQAEQSALRSSDVAAARADEALARVATLEAALAASIAERDVARLDAARAETRADAAERALALERERSARQDDMMRLTIASLGRSDRIDADRVEAN